MITLEKKEQLELFPHLTVTEKYILLPRYRTAILHNEHWLSALCSFLAGKGDYRTHIPDLPKERHQKASLLALGYTVITPQEPKPYIPRKTEPKPQKVIEYIDL